MLKYELWILMMFDIKNLIPVTLALRTGWILAVLPSLSTSLTCSTRFKTKTFRVLSKEGGGDEHGTKHPSASCTCRPSLRSMCKINGFEVHSVVACQFVLFCLKLCQKKPYVGEKVENLKGVKESNNDSVSIWISFLLFFVQARGT